MKVAQWSPDYAPWPQRDMFATLVKAVIFNELDEEEQRLIDLILHFDETLEEFETFYIDPRKKGPDNGLIHGGFFLDDDRLFTKVTSIQHEETFDFLEYQFIAPNNFELLDTLKNITTCKVSNIAQFFSTFSLSGNNYLNLGKKLYTFEGSKIREGSYQPFPVDSGFVCVNIQDFHSDDFAVGYFINNTSDNSDITGKLLLFENGFDSVKVISEFNENNVQFSSLFTVDNKIYLMNYDPSANRFYLLKYPNVN